MIKSITPLLLVALLAGSLTGCSSLYSMTQGAIPKPYAATTEVGQGIGCMMNRAEGMEALGKLFLPIFALDFVGCAVADTAILPVTLTKAVFFAESTQQVTSSAP